jgi:hypothetical protein
MPAPTVLSVTPNDQETDVVLGIQITVLFDSLMLHDSISDATFSLTGPGQTQIISADQLVVEDPQPITGREYITGVLAFDDTPAGGTRTLVTFTPSKPLRPNVTYTLLILGSGGALTSASVKNASSVAMVGSYTWSFTTGALNLVFPPPSAPVPGASPALDPSTIIVIPRVGSPNPVTNDDRVGGDPSQEIDLIFPDSVSLSPYDPTPDILSSIEPILGDPLLSVPAGLTVAYTWQSYGGKVNRKLKIVISGF